MVATHRNQERRSSFLDKVDALLFVFAGLATIWLGYLLFVEGTRPGWQLLLLIVFWILLTYLLLPRLHRIMTRIYVPGYFIGRARTSDGLLGDPVNLTLLGHEAQVHEAMSRAGWSRADDLSLPSALGMVRSTLTRRSYPEAPVSPLLLFDRTQDFAYQQEVNKNPAKRHHVRFWKAPDGWLLPGGFKVDWLAAGTYDRSVGLSLFTLQITHKIEENTDIERDYIIETVTKASPEVEVEVIRDFSTGYHSRNGGGDLIQTDGDLPILDVRPIEAEPLPVLESTDSRTKRPAQIIFGSAVSFVRGGFWALAAVILLFLNPVDLGLTVTLDGVPTEYLFTVGGIILLVAATWDIGLGIANLLGRNWARLLLMLTSVLAVITAFISNADRSAEITLGTLPTVAISILVLLALSSHRAREYASSRRHRPKRLAGRPRDELTV
jgi:LssY C-terminus